MEIFNEEDVYDNEISPLLRQIIDICNKHNIPMIASFVYENCEDRGPGCCTTLINDKENRVHPPLNKMMKVIKYTDEVSTMAITISNDSSGDHL